MKNKWKKRRQYQKYKTFLTGGIAIVLCVCVLSGNMIRKDSLMYSVIRQGRSEGYFQMLRTVVPSIFYKNSEQTLEQFLMERIFEMVPGYRYVTGTEDYATQTESDISYETIIAREARDENYVDQNTGEVVTSGEVQGGDSVGQTSLKEGDNVLPEDRKENQEMKQEAPEEEEPSDTPGEAVQVAKNSSGTDFIPNNTPVATYPDRKSTRLNSSHAL